MSIEHFLDSKEKTQRPTFKKVMGRLFSEKEPPEDTRPWKWEEEITERDWEKMDKQLEVYIKPQGNYIGDHVYVSQYALSMYLIDSEHPIKLNDVTWKNIARVSMWSDDHTIAYNVSAIYILNYHNSPQLSEQNWKVILKKLEEFRGNDWLNFTRLAISVHVLDQQFPLSLDAKAWREMEDSLENFRKNNEWSCFVELASNMRFLNSNFSIQLDARIWKSLSKELEEIKQHNIPQFAWDASHMRILAAHKVEITKEGIIITDKPTEQLDVALPPRPIRKKH